MRKENSSGGNLSKVVGYFFFIFIAFIVLKGCVTTIIENDFNDKDEEEKYVYNDGYLNIVSSSENKILDEDIKAFAKKNGIKINIHYEDTLDIIANLNNGTKYDAVWLANSIWNYKMDKSISLSESKSMSINPVIFGIKKSKAQELGFVGHDIKTKDILEAIKQGKLKFSMSNPNSTNSGAVAYLGILSTLAGNPDVLTLDMLNKESLKNDMKAFFSGLERTSGDEDYLEELFLNGDYEAVISYESSIININKKLEKDGKEPLYAIYPVDGVSISDSIFALVNNKDDNLKEDFLKIQNYFLGSDGQKILLNYGRRTWYGGTTDNAPKDVFNPNWGIDTTKMISPLKYPSDAVIDRALEMYQEELRKPIHVVFCLDYSGSMNGDGYKELVKAMEYILDNKRASADHIQFTSKDKIDVISFNEAVTRIASGTGKDGELLIGKINSISPFGGTSLYPSVRAAINLLKDETSEYNVSVIVMTDGEGNIGYLSDVVREYDNLKREIPIYSITFGEAVEGQLNSLANLSNGKVFDGKTDLVEAFKQVRGYN